jgi:hypothetical protein
VCRERERDQGVMHPTMYSQPLMLMNLAEKIASTKCYENVAGRKDGIQL